MIFFVWAFSFGIMAPPLAEVWGKFGLKESTFSCTILMYVTRKKCNARPRI